MKYHDGNLVQLGDAVTISIHTGAKEGRVVMLGDTYEHLSLDPDFVAWVKKDKIIDSTQVAIQWVGENPLAHSDPRYAPVGDIMFTTLDRDVVRKEPNQSPQPTPPSRRG